MLRSWPWRKSLLVLVAPEGVPRMSCEVAMSRCRFLRIRLQLERGNGVKRLERVDLVPGEGLVSMYHSERSWVLELTNATNDN